MKILLFPAIAISIIILYVILLGDLEMTITRNQEEKKFEYNGLVWVLLDRYTIHKYNSKDIPKKIFTYTKTKTNI